VKAGFTKIVLAKVVAKATFGSTRVIDFLFFWQQQYFPKAPLSSWITYKLQGIARSPTGKIYKRVDQSILPHHPSHRINMTSLVFC